jgi:hypothetical protein
VSEFQNLLKTFQSVTKLTEIPLELTEGEPKGWRIWNLLQTLFQQKNCSSSFHPSAPKFAPPLRMVPLGFPKAL